MLPQLAAYLSVVAAGSFTAAARQTKSDKTVLSRRVKALEEALGVRLLNRTTRSIHVTEAGRRLVDEAREPVRNAMAALVRTSAPDHLEGSVRVASAQLLAQALWIPVLARLGDAHPQLRVDLSASETFSPLVDEGLELAIRIGRMPDSSFISRRLATWRHVLVGSPGWVGAHPEVQNPADLPPHWLMWTPTFSGTQDWTFRRDGEELALRVDRSRLMFDASQLLVESARGGLGVAAVPPFLVMRELEEGSLVRVLPDWAPIHELGVFAVTPHRTMQPARVHVVLEAVRERVAELEPIWEQLTA
jgi:DNA-binding transcriptional LysR family regulator